MRFIVLLLVVVLLVAVATYAILNLDQRVDVNLPWTSVQDQPQIYLTLVALGAGMVFVGILSLVDGTRLRLANRRLRREADRLRDRLPLATPPAPPAESAVRQQPERQVPPAGESTFTDEDPPYGM